MGKKVKTGKSRRDKFYQLAKETGFRSRASFKLIQLNRRYNFLGSSKVLIDLCAAPGSWLQVAVREMPISSKIIGVDLVPIQSIPRVKTFQADITSDKCRLLIKNELNGVKADVILNDGAPNVGTAWSIDEYNQAQLCLKAFSLATDFLKKGGWFITKVFRSKDYEPLKWVLSHFFKTIKSIKPEASRLESAEIFIVAQNYLAPDKIDPKFLDQKHVFNEVDQPQDRNEIIAKLMKHSMKKRAIGYEDGDTLYKETSVMEFIEAEDPLLCLAKTNRIIMDIPEISNHPSTTNLVKSLLADIRVLGKADIKTLVKWHKKIVEAIKAGDKQESIEDEEPISKEPTEEDLEEDLEVQIANAMNDERKELKKQLKKTRLARRKLAERVVNKMHHVGDIIEHGDDYELFNLKEIHGLDKLYESGKLIGDTSVTGIDDIARKQEAERQATIDSKAQEDIRTAVEGLRTAKYTKKGPDRTDEHLEDLTKNDSHDMEDIFMSSSGEESESEDSDSNIDDDPLKALDVSDQSESGDENANILPPELAAKRKRILDFMNKKYRSKDKTENEEEEKEEPEAKKSKPFNILLDLDDQDEMTKKRNSIKKWCDSSEMKHLLAKSAKSWNSNNDDDDSSEVFQDFLSDQEDEEKGDTDKRRIQKVQREKSNKKQLKDASNSGKSVQFNTQGMATTDIEKHVEEASKKMRRLKRPLTPEERALAVKLISSVKSRRELMEWNFHRFRFFEDESQLPDWFVEDERKNMRRPNPYVKKTDSAEKPIQGRTIRKVEEAKLRKKHKIAKKLKKVRQKADQIDDEIPEREKWDKIKTMYQKAGLLKQKRRPIHYVVNSKGGNKAKPAPKGAKIKLMDRRMKKDLRGKKRAEDRKSKKGRAGKKPTRGRKTKS